MDSLLAHSPLFAGVPPEGLGTLHARARERSFGPGEIVFHQGDPGDALFVVVEGRVKVFVTSPRGETMVLAVLGPNDAFGELSVLDGEPRSASVQALEESRLMSISREAVLDALVESPAIATALLRSMGGLARRLIDQAGDLVFLDLPGRLAKALMTLAGEHGERLRVTQGDLAAMIGGSRQSVNLILHGFRERGLVELGKGKVVVRDRKGLERRAGTDG